MKRLVPYIAFACLTAFTATNGLPVMAGGCSSNRNKTAKIKCAKNDTECLTNKAKNFDLEETTKS